MFLWSWEHFQFQSSTKHLQVGGLCWLLRKEVHWGVLQTWGWCQEGVSSAEAEQSLRGMNDASRWGVNKRTHVGKVSAVQDIRAGSQGKRQWLYAGVGFDFILLIPVKLRYKVVFTLNSECPHHRQQVALRTWLWWHIPVTPVLGANEERKQSGRQSETVSINQPVYPSINQSTHQSGQQDSSTGKSTCHRSYKTWIQSLEPTRKTEQIPES